MHFITSFAASLAVGCAAAAPSKASIQPFVESGGQLELNPAMYIMENFTATDGETYEIVKGPLVSNPLHTSSGNTVQQY
jgi:hypothetical protein